MILREDFGTGPLPDLPPGQPRRAAPARPGDPLMTATEDADGRPARRGASSTSPAKRTCGSSSSSSRSSSPRTSACTCTSAPRTSAPSSTPSPHSTLPLGILDTIVLLTSSWAIARCVQHARAGRYQAAHAGSRSSPRASASPSSPSRWSSGCRLIHEGHTFTSSDFMQYFFFLTGIHAHPPADRVRRARRARPPAVRPEAALPDRRSRRAPPTGTRSISSGCSSSPCSTS